MQKFYDNSTKSHKNRKRNMADKVLIVDDDISICKLLEKVMHSNELDTETAGSGRDALELLKHFTDLRPSTLRVSSFISGVIPHCSSMVGTSNFPPTIYATMTNTTVRTAGMNWMMSFTKRIRHLPI